MFVVLAIAMLYLSSGSAHAARHGDVIAVSTAVFGGSNGITGSVAVRNGNIRIELDLTDLALDESSLPSGCRLEDGFRYHLHNEWRHTDNIDRFGPTECGLPLLGNHFDPQFACGPASGATDCAPTGCIPRGGSDYTCNPSTFALDPTACEVGDWSGKYGVLPFENGKIFRRDVSLFEVDFNEALPPTSIVFHCANPSNTRLFCAPFVLDTVAVTAETSRLFANPPSNGGSAVAVLSGPLDGLAVKFASRHVAVHIPKYLKNVCAAVVLSIHSRKFPNGLYPTESCSVQDIGGIYDPGHSCVPTSESPFCQNDIRCPHTTRTVVDYKTACDESTPYNCGVGDISGRLGVVFYGRNGVFDGNDFLGILHDRTPVFTDLLKERSLKVTCFSKPNYGPQRRLLGHGKAKRHVAMCTTFRVTPSSTV